MKKVATIIFLIIFILTTISVFIVRAHSARLNGSALDGYRSDGRFFIMTYEHSFVEVSGLEWYFDITIWITTFVLIMLSVIGIIFFAFAYFFPLVSKYHENNIKGKMW